MSSPESFLGFFTINALSCPFICNYLIAWAQNSCSDYVKLKEEENQEHCWNTGRDPWLTPKDFGYHRSTWRKAALYLPPPCHFFWDRMIWIVLSLTDPVLCKCEPWFKSKSMFYCGMMELCQSCLVRRGFLDHAGTLFPREIADMASTRVNDYVSVCGLSSWDITWAVRLITRGRELE